MAAPAFGSAGTPVTYASSSGGVDIPVPSGVAANDIIIAQLYKEGTMAVTPPSGFTELTGSPVIVASGGSIHRQHVFWKRATGGDTGNYSFTWTGSSYRIGVAHRYTGCITSGSPLDGNPNTASRTTNATGTPAVSLTTSGTNRLIVWCATGYGPYSCTPPTNYTERVDFSEALTAATREQASAGSTGSITGTMSGSSGGTALLLALIPATTVDSTEFFPFFDF